MVRHKVNDYIQSCLVTTLYKVGKLLHTVTLVLAKVRVYIIVVGNGIWATRKTFDDTWGIVHCCRMADDACVPHMSST